MSDVSAKNCCLFYILFCCLNDSLNNCRLIDDSSSLATNCNKWRDAKWGYHKNTAKALAYHTFYIPLQRHWNLLNGRFECDGIKDAAISVGDFWEVYVRWRDTLCNYMHQWYHLTHVSPRTRSCSRSSYVNYIHFYLYL